MLYRNFGLAVGVLALALVAVTLIALIHASTRTAAGGAIQGDTNCNQQIDTMDALGTLQKAADIEPFADCVEAGDVDCDQDIDADDAVAILVHLAGIDPVQPVGGCTPIGQPLASGTPTDGGGTTTPTIPATPTPAPTPAPTPTPAGSCAGVGGEPTLPGDPGGTETPQADAYLATTFLPANYLGDAAEPAIEFALMPGHPNVAIVATQDGYIYRVALNQSSSVQLWGDLHTIVEYDQGEQGLLSVAFSPDFENDCRVYAYYSTENPDETRLARFQATTNGLDESSLEIVLHIEDFAVNHNGGHIAFDSDGYLYLSTGDGGGGDDPQDTGQDLTRLLGKVLRLDVSGATGYAIPPSNPFQDGAGSLREEIFAYGLRNPFRMTIDPLTDQIWLGDVGQAAWEEVDLVTSGGNYGWDCREGPVGHGTDAVCTGKTFIEPRAYFDHGDGNQAVTGGVVYRGDDMPELYGWYIYADFYSGNVWAVDTNGTAPPVHLMDAPFNTSSFTLGLDGEVYFVSYSDGIYKLTR